MRDHHTYALFDESELGPPKAAGTAGLVLRPRGDGTLSKEQRSFNRLTKQIATLQRRIATERDKLERLLAAHNEEVRPLELTLAGQHVELAKRLADSTGRLRYTKRQYAELRTMIVELCESAFSVMPPDGQTEAFYDQWAATSYREVVEAQAHDLKQNLAEEVRMAFGVDVDDCAGDASPEGMARFMNHLEEKLRTAEPADRHGRRRRKKTAKQLEKDERMKAQEALAKKAVRGIYLSLAKILHPDTIADPQERARREEFMKRATSAYRQGDLCSLLELELQWAADDGDWLSAFSDETLDVYIRALKDQVAQLEDALHAQAFDPRYADIHGLAMMAERKALTRLRERAEALQAAIDETEEDLDLLSRTTRKAQIMALVRDYIAQTCAKRDLESLAAALFQD